MSIYNQDTQVRSSPIMLSPHNRAIQYGDGLFETIRLVKGRMPLFNYHVQRLQRGLDFLEFKTPIKWDMAFWRREIYRLTDELESHRESQNFRIRIQVYRQDGGLYQPTTNCPTFIITATSLKETVFPENAPGLHLGLYPHQAITPAPLSNHKTTNSLVYILAAKFAGKHNYDECLLLNAQRQVAEGYYSNLFVKKSDTWLTPPLSTGGVAGTFRAFLLDYSKQLGIRTEEAILTLKEIESARAIWLSNSIRGLQWVKSYKNTTFEPSETSTVIRKINDEMISDE